MRLLFGLLFCFILFTSCVSTKSTLKNVDANAPIPVLVNNRFLIHEVSPDKKYGYDPDYPVNLFYSSATNDTLNVVRFFNSITGPKGETLQYRRVSTCCPFPTQRHPMGAGLIDLYEVQYEGLKQPITLYLNIYETSTLYAPQGFLPKPM